MLVRGAGAEPGRPATGSPVPRLLRGSGRRELVEIAAALDAPAGTTSSDDADAPGAI